MSGFKEVSFADRQKAAQEARKNILNKFRAQPGAEFPAHHHDDDEEAYVLSGDLSFDDLVLGAGDYHLARPGVRHPVGRTRRGCMLLVTAAA